MAEEEVGLRLSLKERRETARGLDDVDGRLAKIGRTSEKSGRQADAGARGIERLTGGIRKLGKVAATGLVAGVAAAGYTAVKVTQSAIAEASNLNESLNAVNVSYGKQAAAVKRLGRQAATSLGLSNVEFNSLGVRFSSFVKTIAGPKGGKAVVTTLDDLTTRASDFASVMNLEVADAAALFQSGLAGESEPLRAYGIDLSAASVSSYAYANGIAEAGSQLTSAQKVQAAYGSLMEQTAQTAGDFSKTSDQLANSQRILGARWDNAKAKLGAGLLPILTSAVGWLNREGIPAFERFADKFNKDGVPAIQRFIDKAKPLASEVLPAVKTTLGTVRDVAADLAPKIQAVVGAFNDMPDWAKTALITGGGAAAVGSKLGLGKLASTGMSLATKAKPLPVFVTNPGGLGGAPGLVPGGPGAAGKTSLLSRLAPLALVGLPLVAATAASSAATTSVNKTPPGFKTVQGADGATATSREAVTAIVEAEKSTQRTLALGQLLATGMPTKIATGLTNPLEVATTRSRGLADLLGVVGRTRVAPTIDANTSGADAKINRLLAKMGPLLTLGVSAVATAEPRATGGPVVAGRSYVVGERRPELFVPNQSGRIMPRVPKGRSDGGPESSGGSGGWDSGWGSVTVPVYLDGQKITEVVLDRIDGMRARG